MIDNIHSIGFYEIKGGMEGGTDEECDVIEEVVR